VRKLAGRQEAKQQREGERKCAWMKLQKPDVENDPAELFHLRLSRPHAYRRQNNAKLMALVDETCRMHLQPDTEPASQKTKLVRLLTKAVLRILDPMVNVKTKMGAKIHSTSCPNINSAETEFT
jgi:hypothetical protein